MSEKILSASSKHNVIDILSKSFDENQSLNYIVRQDKARAKRIRSLMEYSYNLYSRFGQVLLSQDKSACALILYPNKKKVTIHSVFWDIKLIFQCIGFKNILKTLRRESLIKRTQPKELMTYLWFIGVDPREQNKGKGSLLLKSILDESKQMNRIVCRETSTPKNLPTQNSNRGHKVTTSLESFMVGIWCGANRFLHTEITRSDRALGKILGWKTTPGQDAYKRYFKKFSQSTNLEVGGHFFSWFFKNININYFTLDIDSTIMTRYGSQQGAKKGYNLKKPGRKSHHQIIAFVN